MVSDPTPQNKSTNDQSLKLHNIGLETNKVLKVFVVSQYVNQVKLHEFGLLVHWHYNVLLGSLHGTHLWLHHSRLVMFGAPKTHKSHDIEHSPMYQNTWFSRLLRTCSNMNSLLSIKNPTI